MQEVFVLSVFEWHYYLKVLSKSIRRRETTDNFAHQRTRLKYPGAYGDRSSERIIKRHPTQTYEILIPRITTMEEKQLKVKVSNDVAHTMKPHNGICLLAQ